MFFSNSLPTEKLDRIRLLDGDKIMSLFAVYFTRALSEIQNLQKKLLSEGVNIIDHDFASWKVGSVQTAYANGASTYFLRNELGLEVKICPTGVKHLHSAAHHFDIGIYFEANGHGTLLYKESRMEELENFLTNLRSFDVLGLLETHKAEYKRLENVAYQMMLLLRISNQVILKFFLKKIIEFEGCRGCSGCFLHD